MPPSSSHFSAALPRRAAGSLAAVVVLVALGGCSGGRPELDVDGFRPGACTSAVPTLQDVDDALRRLEDDELSPRDAAARFAQAQDALAPAAADADGALSASFDELGSRLGFFRLSVDTGSSDDSEVADVRRALDGLAQDCRGG